MRVLFLSHWYPHRKDEMLGLFVQKHADAVSIYADEVRVLYVHPDDSLRKHEVEQRQYHNVKEVYCYFPTGKGIFKKLTKHINYLRAYHKSFKLLKEDGWSPDIIHANVLTRTVIIAFLYKLLTGTPYVITEHWTRLLKVQNNFNGFFRKIAARIVVKNAGCIMPVSIELKEGLGFNKLLLTRCEIVENVVDTLFYEEYESVKHNKKQLLNITCFNEKHKNLFGLLRTARRLSEERDDFQLLLVGTGDDFEMTKEYYKSLDFPKDDVIVFTGLKTSPEVAEMMHQVDAIVQFSNYESAGVVVQEALVSGRPVISSRVGIAPDYINASNGILVDIQNEEQLYQAITHILDNIEQYDNKAISHAAQNEFSYERIGKKYYDIYLDVLKQN